jgi:putative membrane protein
MIGDHTAVNDQALALVKKLNVTPEDNATSKGLAEATDAERKKLANLSGVAFDKAYVDNEVAYHKAVDDVREQDAHSERSKCGAENSIAERPEIVRGPPSAR